MSAPARPPREAASGASGASDVGGACGDPWSSRVKVTRGPVPREIVALVHAQSLDHRELAARGSEPPSEPPSEPTSEPTSARAEEMKRAMVNLKKHCCCPISLEPFVDPVSAQDGQVYERKNIETWILRAENPESVKSPTTGAPMGSNLEPCQFARAAVEGLMEAKAFRPEQIEAWRAAVAKHESDKKAREEMLDSAKAGAGGACFALGHAYMHGNLGFPKDAETAYRWWRRSADLGHAEGAFLTAAAFLHKDEKAKGVVEQNIRLGDAYLHIAAALGHGNSCYEMGRRFHSNRAWGNDHEMATFWYKQAACPTFGASRECRDAAQKWLEDPNDRPPPGAQLSFERKAELGENIRRLDAEGLAGVIRIIGDYEGSGRLEPTDESIEIDLNTVEERTLRALSAFVSGWVAGMDGHREATAFGGAEAAGDDDQMSDEGDADGQDDNGEESAPPPPGMEQE